MKKVRNDGMICHAYDNNTSPTVGDMQDRVQNNNQFLRIDFSILKINEIVVSGKKEKFSASAKQLYCYLLNWPEAFPSHNKIAEVFGITRKAAEKQIKKLIELGLIERVSRPGSSNLYRVMPITEEMITGRSYSENKGTKFEQLPVEICEATMPEQESRIKAALPPGNNEQPDKDEHAMVLQPAKRHEPCQIYLQKLYAPFFSCLKIGIAKNTNLRIKQQKANSMFKHQVLKIWTVKNRKKALEIEGIILKEFERSQCLKEWLPDGATETLPLDLEREVIEKVNQLITKRACRGDKGNGKICKD